MLRRIRTGLEWLRSPYTLLDGALARGELSFHLDLPVMGRSLITGDPAVIADIVRNKELIGGRGTQALRPVVGDHSLIVLEGGAHERQRKLLLPHFFTGDMTAHDAITGKWVQRGQESLAPDATFSGMKFTADITLNIIIEVLFGTLPPERHAHGVGLVRKWLASFTNPAVLFLKPLHINLGQHSAWGRFLANRAALHRFIQELIDTPGTGGVLGDILAAGAGSDEEVISQMITFLMFGHDTSAAAMGWFYHHLLQDSDALAKVRAEIASTQDVDSMVLLRSAILESMRLSPVVVHLTRHAVASTEVGGFKVGKGERVLPCMYLAQRNPAVFEHPTRFMAERFVNPPADWRYAFFPFGLGNRLCAGMPFALRQMVLIASQMLSACQLELVHASPAEPVRNMVLIVPAGGPLLRRAA
jgi:cytochrome P450